MMSGLMLILGFGDQMASVPVCGDSSNEQHGPWGQAERYLLFPSMVLYVLGCWRI